MIWVIKHTLPDGDTLWWRPKASGYTVELVAAGAYTEAEAAALAARRPEQDVALPLTQVLAGLDIGTVGSAFGMRSYRGSEGP